MEQKNNFFHSRSSPQEFLGRNYGMQPLQNVCIAATLQQQMVIFLNDSKREIHVATFYNWSLPLTLAVG